MKRTLRIRTCILENKFFDLSDPEAIEIFGEAFGPELEQLKNAYPTAESSPTDTAEVSGNENASPSQRLFGGDYVEVNRTVRGMLALKWLM
ncbi:MAG: hypothetical protein Q9187_007436, partial [Circinaria calcarea]